MNSQTHNSGQITSNTKHPLLAKSSQLESHSHTCTWKSALDLCIMIPIMKRKVLK